MIVQFWITVGIVLWPTERKQSMYTQNAMFYYITLTACFSVSLRKVTERLNREDLDSWLRMHSTCSVSLAVYPSLSTCSISPSSSMLQEREASCMLCLTFMRGPGGYSFLIKDSGDGAYLISTLKTLCRPTPPMFSKYLLSKQNKHVKA